MKALILSIALMSSTAMAHPSHNPNMGHLSFGGGRLHAHLTWIQGPAVSPNETKMRLEWHDGATHALIDPGLPFEVSLFMPDMGHGSSPTQTQKIVDDKGVEVLGTYQISKMFFIMAGSWEVRVTLKYADGTEETQPWAVDVGGASGHQH